MNTKLTITLDKQVIKKAKAYAKNQNRSLSDLIESYLRVLTGKESMDGFKTTLSPTVRSLLGSAKKAAGLDYKKTVQEYLLKKYKR